VAVTAPGAPAWLSRRGTSDRCHVTVQASNRRVDLALPTTVPILELTPTLARLCRPGAAGQDAAEREVTPPAWTLARAASAPFDLTSTLAEAGVLDGEVLHLVDASTWRAPQLSDLAGSTATPAGPNRRPWTASATSWLLSGLSTAALGLPLLALGVDGALDRRTGVLALAGALAALALLGRGVGGRRPTRLALLAAVVVLGGAAGAGLIDGRGPLRLAGAGLGAGLALLALIRTLPALAPGGALAAGVLALAAATVAGGVALERTAAAAAVVGCLALQLWPAAGDRHPAPIGRSGGTSAGPGWRWWGPASLSAGIALVVLVAGLILLTRGGWPGVGLAGAAAVGLCLRARSRPLLAEALPPAVAGAALLLGLEVLAGVSLAAHGQALAGVALVAGLSLGLIALAGSGELPGPPAPLTRLGWLGVDLALVALTPEALGVVDQAVRLAHHVIR